ncbi:[FeFe] hydrogenase H-cluster radical SAM maturase HydE [Tindallia californiensis]|uniref:Iron-only hydrogenase maturation protein HydE n=1 Tax=Tindallia californiensis TaxID=159292 RepID=A0A1H3QFX8_9FIRM|nr:[FeFe] hydrogenase H-cluster radical SAM maturase HydE [Tindallia californiensis]SDZ12200.1 iron-only hydrogenase maturation protein HydE [Tindallia californiensis]
MIDLVEKLYTNNTLRKHELIQLLRDIEAPTRNHLIKKAHATRMHRYGDLVYMRGLIEFTNYCHQNCQYCGIRSGNPRAERYRLSLDEILDSCRIGSELGFRTFVLQGGEDLYYNDERIVEILERIKEQYPESAITLSIGEKSRESYQKFYNAGADRYLLRHETASRHLYERMHPDMTLDNRIKCLQNLKEIGFQVGTGFLVGLPGQTLEDYVEDLIFLQELKPHMVGIGPFIPHQHTPMSHEQGGSLTDVITLLAIIRLLLPDVLLPATTALGSIDPIGREKGLKAGANVVMPNLSPTTARAKYALYDGKISTGDEAAECRICIEDKIRNAGFTVDMSRGDHIDWRGLS